MSKATPMQLTARLVVQDADAAIAFYTRVFSATLVERFPMGDGHIAHAALSIDGQYLALTEERLAWNNASPTHLGGTPVLLQVVVPDVDALAKAFLEAGGAEVIPLADQFYGKREGRFQDPFGHLWILSQVIEELSTEEISRRSNAL